jgi:putative serine protease PepD
MSPPASPEITVTSDGPGRSDVMEIGSRSAVPGALRRLGARLGNHRRKALVAVAVLALVLTATVFYRWGSSSAPAAAPSASARPSPSPSREPTPAEVYTAVAPSVVSIEAASSEASGAGSAGTGVVVNGQGMILTAFHVVKGAAVIQVTFADGTKSAAAVLASDPANDIAILMPRTLPSIVVPATLGSSGRLAVGDGVIAIGNPLGMTRSTTTGVVSGLNRGISSPDGIELKGLIQFDAAVNPGSSGGPLLNSRGETVGIVVALANPTSAGTFIGIGFAVPIGTALSAGGGDRAPPQ